MPKPPTDVAGRREWMQRILSASTWLTWLGLAGLVANLMVSFESPHPEWLCAAGLLERVDFDFEKVARFPARKVEALLKDPGIVRHDHRHVLLDVAGPARPVPIALEPGVSTRPDPHWRKPRREHGAHAAEAPEGRPTASLSTSPSGRRSDCFPVRSRHGGAPTSRRIPWGNCSPEARGRRSVDHNRLDLNRARKR